MNPEQEIVRIGKHRTPEDGMCIMELVSFVAKEPFSDAPACTCQVIASLCRGLNDRIVGDALRTELLRPLLPKLIGTRGSRELQVRRALAAADAAVRVFAPAALDHRKRTELAAELRALPEIVDRETAIGARKAAAAAAAAYAADAAAAYAADADAAYAAYAAAAAAQKVEYQKCVDLILRLCEMRDP